jgi:hypothetical protein
MKHAGAITDLYIPVARHCGETWHVDLVQVAGNKGLKQQFLMGVDDKSGYVYGVLLDAKSDVIGGFKRFVEFTALHGHKVVRFMSDHEHSFVATRGVLQGQGILLDLKPPGRHERRWERTWQTLLTRVRTLLVALPFVLASFLVPHLFMHVVDVYNLVPNKASGPTSTPAWLFTGRRDSVDTLAMGFGDIGIFKMPIEAQGIKPNGVGQRCE